MKILLVSPFSKDTILGVIGCYCNQALCQLGHEVKTFDFRKSQFLRNPVGAVLKKGLRKIFPYVHKSVPLINSLETDGMNKALLKAAEEYKPEVIIVLMGDNILPDTIKKIKENGVITVNWFHDTILASVRQEFITKSAPVYDHFFIIDSLDVLKYSKQVFPNMKYLPLASNPDVHKSLVLSEKEKKIFASDVCFVGTVKFQRAEVLSQLIDFNLGIWGNWENKDFKLNKYYRKQHVYAETAVKIYNAASIVVDIPVPYGTGGEMFYVTPRVFEVPASGAFLLTKKTPYLAQLYEIGKELICYRDESEIKELVKYYLGHPQERLSIAKKAQERAYRDHTYVKRLKELIVQAKGKSV